VCPNYGLITASASAFVQNGKFAVIGTYDEQVIFDLSEFRKAETISKYRFSEIF
jgi:hypothetical protein